jgi:hypothetical protein
MLQQVIAIIKAVIVSSDSTQAISVLWINCISQPIRRALIYFLGILEKIINIF